MRREEVLVNGSEWFYLEAGQQRGPVSLESLVDLLRTLPPGTLVWRDGLVDWMKAEDVPEVGRQLAPPPPRPALSPFLMRPFAPHLAAFAARASPL